MELKQVQVLGRIALPTNQPPQLEEVVFELTRSDWEGEEFVAKKKITAQLLEAGRFQVGLWPNEAGKFQHSRYKVTVKLGGGAAVDPIPDLYIPEAPAVHLLEDLVEDQTVLLPGYKNRRMLFSQFTRLSVYERKTIYLTELG